MIKPPRIILLDDETETVGSAALALIRLGVEPLYSKWLDEAQLFASQAAERVGAAIASSRLSLDELVAFRDAVRAGGSEREIEVLLIGPQTDPAASEALRREGFSSVLWEPFNKTELRFAVSSLLLMPKEIAPRREPRAAANRMCWMYLAGTRSFGALYTVSARGAYVETPSPLPVGTEFRFEFEDHQLETDARVIYSIGRDEAREFLLACGIGCLFTSLNADLQSALRARVAQAMGRHRLPAASEAGASAGEVGAAASGIA